MSNSAPELVPLDAEVRQMDRIERRVDTVAVEVSGLGLRIDKVAARIDVMSDRVDRRMTQVLGLAWGGIALVAFGMLLMAAVS